MQRLRETIDIDVFSLDPTKKLDPLTFQHLKSDITQQIETQNQCHCTICGTNLFDTIFVFDGYSCFCDGCESQFGMIERSVHVFVTLGQEEVPPIEAREEMAEEQMPALIKQIEWQEISEHMMVIEEDQPEGLEEIVESPPPLPENIFQPNQEMPIDEEQQKKNRLKTLMLRQRHAIFQPLKYQLHFFNDQVFDLIVGYTHEKTKKEHVDNLLDLMRGWTFRDYLIEKKYAQYYGLNKELKEKFGLEESIELSEDNFNLGSDESSDSQVIVRLRQKTEELQNLAKQYIGDNSESE